MAKKENEKRVRENGESPLDTSLPENIKVSVDEPLKSDEVYVIDRGIEPKYLER